MKADLGEDEVSLEVILAMLLRWRRVLVAASLAGALAGAAFAVFAVRKYTTSAAFIPQSSDANLPGGLALAASQLGIQMPTPSNSWGPAVYTALLHERALLEPIALDTVALPEEGGRRVPVMDLLEIPASLSPPRRVERAVAKLTRIVDASEDKKIGGVRVEVRTAWPSVSFFVVDRLVRGVNRFNLETRKSQAAAERQFVEEQGAEALQALRAAEDQMQGFLQRNRAGLESSPDLMFQRDRLQREVNLRQSVYTSLMQNQQEARIREVRDTPVITVLEEPRVAATPSSRHTILKILLGAVAGFLLATMAALAADGLAAVRRSSRPETRELLSLLDEATPGFLRRSRL